MAPRPWSNSHRQLNWRGASEPRSRPTPSSNVIEARSWTDQLIFYSVGVIVGAGVYSVIGSAAGLAQGGLWLSFVVGAGIALLTAFSYAEMATSFPIAGAEYAYIRQAWPRADWLSFTVGIVILLGGAATAATVSMAFAGYLRVFVDVPATGAALALLVLCSAVNVWGLRGFGVTYDWNKLVSDPVYNTQMGAAELSALLREYRGSHIMTFAGYNAGRGRVQEWVKAYGDPRDPKVDAVDWVERIPFAETRNYVQRVMESLQVYRVRLNVTTPAISYLNLLRGNEETNSNRAGSVEASALP